MKTIEDVKKVAEKMSDDFRINHKIMELSFPDQPDMRAGFKRNKGTMILLLADYTGKPEEDLDVAKKTFALSLAKSAGINCSPSDFQNW